MASVRQRSPGRWQLIVYTGRDPLTGEKQYTRQTVDATGKRDAHEKARRWELELRDGQLSGDGGTFGELCNEWIKVKSRRWSPSTLKEHRRIVRTYLARPLADVDVARIRTHTLDVLYGELAERGGACRHRPCPRPVNCGVEGHPKRCQRVQCVRSWVCPRHDGGCANWVSCEESPCEHGAPLDTSTVNRIHTVVRSALEQAVKWGWILRNPAEYAEPGEIHVKEVEVPEDVDVVRYLAVAQDEDERLGCYLAMSIETGARRGAMHGLRRSYIEFNDDGTSTVRFPKVIVIGDNGLVERAPRHNKRTPSKRITLGPHVTAMLRAHLARQDEVAGTVDGEMPADAFVFSDDLLGESPWRPDSTSRKFRHLRIEIDLDDETRLHDLRHKMATELLSAGLNPRAVAERGGWRRVATMLDRYAHFLPADDQDAAGLVDRLLQSQADYQPRTSSVAEASGRGRAFAPRLTSPGSARRRGRPRHAAG
jgi:integrase